MICSKRFIAFIGLNLLGAGGVGKNVCIVRCSSRVTKLFVACCAGAFEEALHACWGAREGAAASEGAMVEGIGHQSTQAYVEKPTRQGENDFLFFVVPEL